MDQNSPYFKQAKLLVQVLPTVAKQTCFALKGGTAINLFMHDLPRLSVDIDLCYIPIQERDKSLDEIQQTMETIQAELEQQGYQVIPNNPQMTTRLLVEKQQVRIKVELSPVLRGTVHPVATRSIHPEVESIFGFAEIQVLDVDDLYAGKLCAALDRQHPRDLFDCKILMENQGITERLKDTFLVYLMSHSRPMAELLNPNLKSLKESYEKEFKYMTRTEVSLSDLEETRNQLIKMIHEKSDDNDRQFLLNLKQGKADWDSFIYPQAQHLPAIKWKIYNLEQMDEIHKIRAINNLKLALEL